MLEVSTHAPVRARHSFFVHIANLQSFNSRASEGATTIQEIRKRDMEVSTHAPVRARQIACADCGASITVSTHAPVRARRGCKARQCLRVHVSTHAPVRARLIDLIVIPLAVVSTHAPVRARPVTTETHAPPLLFQLTRP